MKEVLEYDFMENVTVKTIIRVGADITAEIADVGSDIGIDLIVMGSHGTSIVDEFLLGSTAEEMVRKYDLMC